MDNKTTEASWLEQVNTRADRVQHAHTRFLRAAIELGEACRTKMPDHDLLRTELVTARIAFDTEQHEFIKLFFKIPGYLVMKENLVTKKKPAEAG